MEQVLLSLTTESSAAHSEGMKAFSMKSTRMLKVKNSAIQIANAPVINR